MTSHLVHLVRHGQSIHNVQRGYPHRDPHLTSLGQAQAAEINISQPDLVIVSPMMRTIQTALLAFPTLPSSQIRIWPDLREAHDAECNKGSSRIDLAAKFPQLDFAECPLDWDYPAHSIPSATSRAESVRHRLGDLCKYYNNIVVISHRGFLAFLVKGNRFDFCEVRAYEISAEKASSFGTNIDTNKMQDFGPTVLVPTAQAQRKSSSLGSVSWHSP